VERLPELSRRHRVVLELSELQLPTLSRGTSVAVYTHVTADHLDRHGSLDAYRAVKRRLAELVPDDGGLVLNDEDPVSRAYGEATRARVVRYRRSAPTAGGVGVVDGWLVAHDVPALPRSGGTSTGLGPSGRLLPLDALPVPGWHSVSNVAAAAAVGLLFGVPAADIRAAVEAFPGVEHRLEPVAVVDGVRFVNDSMGTQPDAVIAAVRSFDRPLVLLCGGRAKGLEVDELARVVAERVSAAIVIGESGPDLAAAFRAAGLVHVEAARGLEEAVRRGDAIARGLGASADASAPATVLLSPAAASFDMFADYAARGRAFRDAVARLATDRGVVGGERAGAGSGEGGRS
jgi:UDP-N-acetylmuramoylalanine--D-glutamate ligase